MTCVRFGVAFVCTWLAPLAAATEAAVEFNRDIRPIFSDKCYTCHGPDAGNRKTKLRFDVEGGAKIDLGKGRQAIAPGDPEKSEVYRRVASDDAAVRMPPAYMGREKLTDREIDLIRRWIGQGAPWERHWSLILTSSITPRGCRGSAQRRFSTDSVTMAGAWQTSCGGC